jgi:hypothetical protein
MNKREMDQGRRAATELAKFALESGAMTEATVAMCLANGGYSNKLIAEIIAEIKS